MSRISTRKFSTIALLTSAVFTISSLAPVEFAPGPFSPDAAFAKSENGKGGGNGGDKGGKGVGGAFAKATKKGGDLINSVFGKDKAKAKKPSSAKATTSVETVTVPREKNIKARMAALNAANADINAFMNASPNSRVGRIRAYADANFAAEQAAAAVEEAKATLAEAETALAEVDTTAIDKAEDAVEEAETALTEAKMTAETAEDAALQALKDASNKPEEITEDGLVKAAVDDLLDANGYNEHLQDEADTAAAVEGETVVDEVSLIGTDGETIALVVE